MALSRYPSDRRVGVLYVAFGDKFIDQAISSAQSVKLHTNVSVTLFCDRRVDNAIFLTTLSESIQTISELK